MKTWGDAIDEAKSVPRRASSTRAKFMAALMILLILVGLDSSFPALKYSVLSPQASHREHKHESLPFKAFQWSDIEAKESFEFHSCFNGFECAKLKLPLDYFNGTHPDHTISLAIAKLPAKVPVDDPRYGGPILINPGGPGGPGALFAISIGEQLQYVVDAGVEPEFGEESSAKYFDIIGFDPRGIGETEPAAECMPDSPSSWSWSLREDTEGIIGSSDATLGRLWSMTHAFGASCKMASDAEDGPDIKQYMSTASVARDMLEIAEKHAEYVADQAAQLQVAKRGTRSKCTEPKISEYKPGTVKLQYWGFSYGTYLGSTFASMFPDRVGRLILDGVVSSWDYNHGLGNGSLTDTEKAWKLFFTYCFLSGPDSCPLATPTSTIGDIEGRVQKILKSIFHNPLPINSPYGPEVLTYSDIRMLIFSSCYQPAGIFPIVAEVLAAVEAGEGAILDDLVTAFRQKHIYSCTTNQTVPFAINSNVPQMAILCGDGVDQTSLDIDSFVEYLDLLTDISPTYGAIWSKLKMECSSWTIQPVHKFEDDFGGNTSHPILFVSNTADPVTPLRSGKYMSEKFPGSVVLIQDSAGHCSLSTPTPCTINYIRQYYQTGHTPSPETLCIPPTSPLSLNSTDPKSPFYDPSLGSPSDAAEVFLVQHQRTMDAARTIQQWTAMNEFGLGRMVKNERIDGALRSLVGYLSAKDTPEVMWAKPMGWKETRLQNGNLWLY